MNSYHNTTSVTGQTLIEFETKAKSQDEQVLDVFKSINQPLAWFEVAGFLKGMNEISLKRSITNLKNKGLLYRTQVLVTSVYGKPSHKYVLIK